MKPLQGIIWRPGKSPGRPVAVPAPVSVWQDRGHLGDASVLVRRRHDICLMFRLVPRPRHHPGSILSSWRPAGSRGDPVIREAKLVGFVILLAVIFLGAHAAGAQVTGPGMP